MYKRSPHGLDWSKDDHETYVRWRRVVLALYVGIVFVIVGVTLVFRIVIG